MKINSKSIINFVFKELQSERAIVTREIFNGMHLFIIQIKKKMSMKMN